MTQAEINAASACYVCYGMSQAEAAMLVLLNAIVAAGGGGGGETQVYQDSFADPNGNVTPDDPTKAALYYPDGGGTTFQWDVGSQTWV